MSRPSKRSKAETSRPRKRTKEFHDTQDDDDADDDAMRLRGGGNVMSFVGVGGDHLTIPTRSLTGAANKKAQRARVPAVKSYWRYDTPSDE